MTRRATINSLAAECVTTPRAVAALAEMGYQAHGGPDGTVGEDDDEHDETKGIEA